MEEKHWSDEYLSFQKEFTGGHRIRFLLEREAVCKKVQVGERLVPARPETVLPATPEQVVPVYEWKCDEPWLQNGRKLEATVMEETNAT
jgi:hypothetical protein